MRRRTRRWALPAIVLLAALSSSCKGNMIRADAIDGLVREVAERHDRYVGADAALSETQKSVYLRSTELLRAVIEAAKQ